MSPGLNGFLRYWAFLSADIPPHEAIGITHYPQEDRDEEVRSRGCGIREPFKSRAYISSHHEAPQLHELSHSWLSSHRLQFYRIIPSKLEYLLLGSYQSSGVAGVKLHHAFREARDSDSEREGTIS